MADLLFLLWNRGFPDDLRGFLSNRIINILFAQRRLAVGICPVFRWLFVQAIENFLRTLGLKVGKHLLTWTKERQFAAHQYGYLVQQAERSQQVRADGTLPRDCQQRRDRSHQHAPAGIVQPAGQGSRTGARQTGVLWSRSGDASLL